MKIFKELKKNQVFFLINVVFGFLNLFVLANATTAIAATCNDIRGTCSGSQVCYQGSCKTRADLGIPSPSNGGTCATNNNDIVKMMQIAVGMTGNDVDGICGSDTITAIQVFQKNQGLVPDGLATLDGQTIAVMGLQGAKDSLCGQNFPICGAGLNCVNNVCVDPNTTGGSSGGIGSAGSQDTGDGSSGSSAACINTGKCPTGLCEENGLCLPKSNFNTGIAGSSSLVDLLTKIIKFLLTFAGIIAVGVLVIGGFWYITSSGNEEQAEKGQKAITNAIIGLVVVILAYTIVAIISATLVADKFTK